MTKYTHPIAIIPPDGNIFWVRKLNLSSGGLEYGHLYLLFTLYSPSIFLTFDYVPSPSVPLHSLCTVHSLPCLISLYSSPSNVCFPSLALYPSAFALPFSSSSSISLILFNFLFSHSARLSFITMLRSFLSLYFPSPIFLSHFSQHLIIPIYPANNFYHHTISLQYHIPLSIQHHPNLHPAH